MKKLIIGIIFLLLAAGGVFWYFEVRPQKLTGYKAVFLSNGQVYFGKLADAGANYKKLSDVYYMVSYQQNSENAEVQRVLRKLGDRELHGPKSEMIINERHILYIEDLKDDSKVMDAIETYEEGGGATAPAEEQPAEEPEEETEDAEEGTAEEDEEEAAAEDETAAEDEGTEEDITAEEEEAEDAEAGTE